MTDPGLLAERYVASVEEFIDTLRGVGADRVDVRASADSWSCRDIAFHVADVDLMMGLRLRRILGEDYPSLAGLDTQASIKLFRRRRADIALAVDSLSATSALNTLLIEGLDESGMKRRGRHSEGHDVTAADLAAFLAMHIEAHTKQIRRITG